MSIRFGASGPNYAPVAACSGGAHAVGEALWSIRTGRTDAVIAGAAEAAVTRLGIGGFEAMNALSARNKAPEKASRPFDRERDGFVLGEGAGILVLEEEEHARRRDARSSPRSSATQPMPMPITSPSPPMMERRLRAASARRCVTRPSNRSRCRTSTPTEPRRR